MNEDDDTLPETLETDVTALLVPFETLAAAIGERPVASRPSGTSPREEGVVGIGDRVHHYQIKSKLGQGGQGLVFEAEHVYLKQRVALKTLASAASAEFAARFLREAQALAVLYGPNVLRVQDAAVYRGTPFVVTELLEGPTVQDHLRKVGSLTINQSLDLMEQLGQVLERQESNGILHRDIKPSNVILRPGGVYCLLDYGLVGFDQEGKTKALGESFQTQIGAVMGTPQYMAPEQAVDTCSIDHRADLFSLGLIAWECLSGRKARGSGKSVHDTLNQAAMEAIPPIEKERPEAGVRLSRILESLLSPHPDDRYPTATDFLQDLELYRYGGKRPYGATIGSVFVAMPFRKSFDSLFQNIQSICGDAKLAARRVDRIHAPKSVWSEIEKEIDLATVVIAVFTREPRQTSPNPNVLTEAAHARALGKPVLVLTTERAERLPFDWRHLPVVRYKNTKSGMLKLRESLLPQLRRLFRGSGS